MKEVKLNLKKKYYNIMENKLNPILNFRKRLRKDVEIKSNLKEKKIRKNSTLKLLSTMITETRESVDSSENS